ncbi:MULTISPECIES: toxin co-regulated pilus biosynthesis Q family protein [unclassified Enterobacter cloacae complex]|uniref:toxin co-regulated pilus biosynthesis Q family protein n=1 Tax=unclassified Enterobacter cloacae complex TaxID=2757714 RepID=UPI001874D9BC|nr:MULTISPECIES: toxin co-regulated pilus biosynthesis Q family protein [unclassified Enterobacter cloacae complex]MBE4946856.1 toxin co-regulated pilus biosynthesis Q family protein [Enterobacter cloacae complex sp. P1B]MBE4971545.1 toxin co-regulated pilus biosynthesis Q family protein [Enterobacter cloacae complex sp. P11RS]
MTNRKLFTAFVAANSLLALNSAHSAPVTELENESGWIRFTEELPPPKPVAQAKPVTPVPAIAKTVNPWSPVSKSTPTGGAELHIVDERILSNERAVSVRESGRDVPLLLAMNKIAPAGWRVRLSPSVASGFKGTVSWEAGDRWQVVADRMLSANGLKAVYGKNDRQIEILYSSQTNNTSKPAPAYPTIQQSPTASSLPVVIKPKSWRIEKGTTLKEGFIEWAVKTECLKDKDKKWTVQWETDTNYRIDYPLIFTGSFEEATTKLFTLYQKAQSPLYVSGYREQCVILIKDTK